MLGAVCYSDHLNFILTQTFAEGLNLQVVAVLLLVSDAVEEVF